MVLDLVTRHAESLLRVARRYSYCADDAQDAYQRAMEILLRHVHRLDPARAGGWLHTVVKHEALAVRAQRARLVGTDAADLDRLENRTAPSPEERVISIERVGRAAEALRQLKAQEAKAIWLKAAGDSYAEICARTGWTYTKVNRCLAEGRRSFLERYAGIESGEACRQWEPLLSAIVDGEAGADDLLQARIHLRNCASCRATMRQLRLARGPLALLLPAVVLPTADDTAAATVEATAGALARIWEWLVTATHDRAAGGAVRLQTLVDAATNHKVAAVAASAAALAGGGVAVEQTRERLPSSATPALGGEAATGGATARKPAVKAPQVVPAAIRIPTPGVRKEPPGTRRERASTHARSVHSPRRSPREQAPAPPSEPLVDPVESQTPVRTPPAHEPPSPATEPRASPFPSTATPRPDATAEFGFES
ncbi:MAG TPA: sigma-70 family RNA polymerase sigma factor [Solirubrobacteraceae bacterium]|nr:sigma-70 family RNA polymerase sigma factor [Solirubrobacteraceae bacterium]